MKRKKFSHARLRQVEVHARDVLSVLGLLLLATDRKSVV